MNAAEVLPIASYAHFPSFPFPDQQEGYDVDGGSIPSMPWLGACLHWGSGSALPLRRTPLSHRGATPILQPTLGSNSVTFLENLRFPRVSSANPTGNGTVAALLAGSPRPLPFNPSWQTLAGKP